MECRNPKVIQTSPELKKILNELPGGRFAPLNVTVTHIIAEK